MFTAFSTSWARWIGLAAFLLLLLSLPRILLIRRYAYRVFPPENAPDAPVAIVLGAGLRSDGTPSAILADRVTTAVNLFQSGKVSQLLMSGSVRPVQYNEPAAMRALAIRLGVPADQILIDPKGARTFDTCLQAKRHYNIASALIVSQKFHLPRALAICEVMGISAVGVRANIQSYHPRSRLIWELREIPATLVALWDAFKTRRINAEEVCSTHPKRTFE